MALTSLGPISGAMLAATLSRPAGSATFGPEVFPPGYSLLGLLLDLRQVTSLTAAITWVVEYSIDGGTTWIALQGGGINVAVSGYTFDGTTLRNPEGGPVRTAATFAAVPRTDLTRNVRVTIAQNETMIAGALVFAW